MGRTYATSSASISMNSCEITPTQCPTSKHQRACRLRHDVKSSTDCSYRSLCSAV